uniref:2-hydroxyglutaryl-CoA dehydratase n=1 Tax=candidate division WOR-3 bacterium TaxID=2052148 RepID=A0A7C2K4Q8_UNCW3
MIFGGIDIGSRTTKVCILENRKLVSYTIIKTTPKISETAYVAMSELLSKNGIHLKDISYIVATGYGRINVPFAHKQVTEISCHALGITFFSTNIRTILDMGGQDLKIIRCDEKGRVLKFIMNDKCAAGVGRFIERIAEILKIPIESVGPLSLDSTNPEKISNYCVIFALEEVLFLLKQGKVINNILAGVLDGFTERIFNMLNRFGIEKELAVCGGIAKNIGIVKRLEKMLEIPLFIPPEPQIVGAIGAAMFAKKFYENKEVFENGGIF